MKTQKKTISKLLINLISISGIGVAMSAGIANAQNISSGNTDSSVAVTVKENAPVNTEIQLSTTVGDTINSIATNPIVANNPLAPPTPVLDSSAQAPLQPSTNNEPIVLSPPRVVSTTVINPNGIVSGNNFNNVVKEEDITVNLSKIENKLLESVSSIDYTVEQMGRINARIDYLKKLNELKTEEHKLAAPIEDKNKSKNTASVSTNRMGDLQTDSKDPVISSYNPVGNIAPPPPQPVAVAAPPAPVIEKMDFSGIKIYSIIGFNGAYNAKINIDGDSTYTVKKGDVLPNGLTVMDINRYYATLGEKKHMNKPNYEPQRIYATGREISINTNTKGGNSNAKPQAGSIGQIAFPRLYFHKI